MVPANTRLPCRICGATAASSIGSVEFYMGFNWPIFDCAACGCRFTNHDETVYDRLHSEACSCYTRYRDLQEICEPLFRAGDLLGLRSLLIESPKYRMVIDEVDRLPPDARILEIGCSRGYLTAYSILAGRNIIGVDVSESAIQAAIKSFDGHFVQADAPVVQTTAPYDLIYHVGTIGCVADPIGMTKGLLAMVKPGGLLIFNAPNSASCCMKGQLWIDSAPPPDVVTLFPSGFWSRQLGDLAMVEEHVDVCTPEQNVVLGLRKLCRRKWRRPLPLPLRESKQIPQPAPSILDAAWHVIERAVNRSFRITGLSRIVPEQPHEFGLFVKLTAQTVPAASRTKHESADPPVLSPSSNSRKITSSSIAPNCFKLSILARPGCWLATETLRHFSRAGYPIAMVIVEKKQRTKYSRTEQDFREAHTQFNEWLSKQHQAQQAGETRWRDLPALVQRAARRIGNALQLRSQPGSEDLLRSASAMCGAGYAEVAVHSSLRTKEMLDSASVDFALLTSSAWLIKEPLLSMPRTRIINAHCAKLPEHRSLDSLPWSIIAGNPLGVTTHFVDAGVDTGPVLLHLPVSPNPGDNLNTLRTRIDNLTPEAFLRTVKGLADGSIKPSKQDQGSGVHHRPMSFDELCQVELQLQAQLNECVTI